MISIIPDDDHVVIPLNAGDNDEVAIVSYLDKEDGNGGVYEFNFGPDKFNCEPKLIAWGDKIHLEGSPDPDVYGDLTVSTATPSSKTYYWNIRNLGQDTYSNTV